MTRTAFALLLLLTAIADPPIEAGQFKSAKGKRVTTKPKSTASRWLDELTVARLEVGIQGFPKKINAKVLQVVGRDRMLVQIEDEGYSPKRPRSISPAPRRAAVAANSAEARRRVAAQLNMLRGPGINQQARQAIVMLKCSTQGITNGKEWKAVDWKKIAGSPALSVTGTTTYSTVSGSTNTVFVLVPTSQKELDKKLSKALEAARLKKEAADRKRLAQEARRKQARNKNRIEIAAGKLALAKRYLSRNKKDLAIRRLNDIVKDYADTPSAAEAKKLLKSL